MCVKTTGLFQSHLSRHIPSEGSASKFQERTGRFQGGFAEVKSQGNKAPFGGCDSILFDTCSDFNHHLGNHSEERIQHTPFFGRVSLMPLDFGIDIWRIMFNL